MWRAILRKIRASECGVKSPIVVKLRDSDDAPSFTADWLRGFLGDVWSDGLAEVTAARLFWELREEQLKSLSERAGDRDSDYKRSVPRLARYGLLSCPKPVVDALLQVLEGRVERVFLSNLAASSSPAVCYPSTTASSQSHLSAAPLGVNTEYAWLSPGGKGSGLRFVDIEKDGWNLGHEDLIDAGVFLISGEPDRRGDLNHGTAVLGVVVAQDNGKGVRGIAHDLGYVGVVSFREASGGFNLANAILRAASGLRFGDVLLIEVQAPGTCGRDWVPVETNPSVFDAIRFASALGVVVVEPAGNAGQGLDDLFAQDSGSILVGGGSFESSEWRRDGSSNWAARVDCFSWARSILTTYDHQTYKLRSTGSNQTYKLRSTGSNRAWGGVLAIARHTQPDDTYCDFSGTSGASAILAGVALAVQGMVQANLKFRLSPWQLRLMLRDPANGTPSVEPSRDKIGVMPDLKKIVDVLGLTHDVYLRDHVGDEGEIPRARRWQSPDIAVLATALQDPQGELGEGSARQDSEIAAPTRLDSQTRIYLRLRNRGSEDADEVQVKLYTSPVTTLLLPGKWEYVGETSLAVPRWDSLTVSPAIAWGKDPTASDDLAWIALAGTHQDPLPSPTLLKPWQQLLHFMRSRKGFACRNVQMVRSSPGDAEAGRAGQETWKTLRFFAPSAWDESLTMRLEILAQLPKLAKVWLEMPAEIADLQGPWTQPGVESVEPLAEDSVFVPVNPHGRNYFRERLFLADKEYLLRIHIRLPPSTRSAPYRITARQLYRDEGMGRATWKWEVDANGAPPP
jgi:subtilase family protein